MTDTAPPTDVTFVAAPAAAPRALPMTMIKTIALRFGAIGLNAVSGIITARALHPEGRGQLAAMIIWPALLAWLTTFGLPSALIYRLRRDDSDSSTLIGWAVVLCAVGAILGTAAGWMVIPWWLTNQPRDVVTAAQICLLATGLSSLTLLGRAAWEAQGHFGRSNASQVLVPLTVVAGLGLLLPFGRLTPYTAAAVYVLAGLPTLLWMMVSIARSLRPSLGGGVAVPRGLLGYGVRSYGVDLCGALAVYLDQALVVGLLNAEAMGIYVVALSLSRVLNAVHSAVASIVFPRVVGLARGDMTRAVARSARMAMLASGALGVVLVLAGPMLLGRLYGASFGAASAILPLLVGEAIASGVAFVFLQSFLAAGRPGVATLIQMVALALTIPIFLTLVPAYGVMGAAAALLSSSIVRLTLTMLAYRPVLGVPVPRLWPDSADLTDLSHYRGSLLTSLGRLRPAGGAK